MTNDTTFDDVKGGRFARVQLRGGPAFDGFAVADPSDARFLRFDSLAVEDDGRLLQISLRLRPAQVSSIEVLADAPRFLHPDGSAVVMPASLWPEDA